MFACVILDNQAALDYYQAHALEKELRAFYQRFTPDVEAYSPWEFFLDLGKAETARHTILELWRELIPAYGQKAVIGLGTSKLLCRAVALLEPKSFSLSGLTVEEKPGGRLLTLPAHDEEKVRPRLPLEVLWPLEAKIRQRLLQLGFKTWGEIAALSPEGLKTQLGEDAYFTWELARGNLPGKLKTVNGEILVPIVREEGMWDLGPSLDKGAKELALILEARWLGCRELTLEGVTQRGQSFWQKRLFIKPCSGITCLQRETRRLWHKLGLKEELRELQLKAEGLEPVTMEQLSLFNKRNPKTKEEQLNNLLNRLRKDYPATVLDRAVRWGISRREQMLSFYDPWRFR